MGVYTGDGSVVAGNEIVHNGQLGIAGQGDGIVVEDNEIAFNNWAGFEHGWEGGGTKWVETDGLIVRRNGEGHAEWGYGAGIQISASSDVTVTDNVVEDNARGITLIMQDRGTGPFGLREVENVTVQGNTIGPGNGPTGLFSDLGDPAYFTSKDNRFVGNTYLLDGESEPFEWDDGRVTVEQWQEYGNDTDGTFR